MKKEGYISKLIQSPDKENSYIAACILRKENTKESKKLLQSISLEERLGTIEDVYEELGLDRTTLIPYVNPQNKLQRHLNAVVDINHISLLYNGKWKPDFNNRNQDKYYLWFEKTSGGWVVAYCGHDVDHAVVGSGFYFKDNDILWIGTKFISIFKDYLPE